MLDKLQAELGGKDFDVVAVNIDRGGADKPAKFLAETNASHIALYTDPSGKLFSVLKAVGMPTTLLIENPGAILEDADPKAQDWLDFVLSEDGQTQFALKGFRPLEGSGVEIDEVEGAEDPSDPFPAPETLLTVADTYGSWSDISDKFFEEDTGIVSQIIAGTGKGE